MLRSIFAAVGLWVVCQKGYSHYLEFQALRAAAAQRDRTEEEA